MTATPIGTRARMAVAVLRDRTVAHRVSIVDGTMVLTGTPGAYIVACAFIRTPPPVPRGRVRRWVDRLSVRLHRWAAA